MTEIESFEEFEHVETDIKVEEFGIEGFKVGVLRSLSAVLIDPFSCLNAGKMVEETHVDVFGDDGGCFGLRDGQQEIP